MKVVLTKHLRVKIAERGIPHEKVSDTVHHPDFIRPTYNLREERYKRFGRKYLMVVVREEQSSLIVVTAHFVGKLPEK